MCAVSATNHKALSLLDLSKANPTISISIDLSRLEGQVQCAGRQVRAVQAGRQVQCKGESAV